MNRFVLASLLSTAVALFSQQWGDSAAPKKAPPPGKTILEKQGCNHCHIVDGKGGTVAPPLDGLAKFRTRRQIVDRLVGAPLSKSLGDVIPQSLMEHVHVPKREAEQIADYISTLKKKQPSAKHKTAKNPLPIKDTVPQGAQFKPATVTAITKEGARIYWEKGCIACHSIGPIGGELGPGLAGVGARRSKAFIENRILAGAMLVPKPGEPSQYAMPPQVSPAQAKKLTEFLMTLPKEASLYQP